MAQQLIMVKSRLRPRADGGHPVALWEQDKAHPGGEAYVAGTEPVQVAKTPGVMGALEKRRIVEVTASTAEVPAEEPASEPADTRDARAAQLMKLRKDDLLDQAAGMDLPANPTKAQLVAAILDREFPDDEE